MKKKNIYILIVSVIVILFTIGVYCYMNTVEDNSNNKQSYATIYNKYYKSNKYYYVGSDLSPGKYIFKPNGKGLIMCFKDNLNNCESIIFQKITEDKFEFSVYYGQYIKCINGDIEKKVDY